MRKSKAEAAQTRGRIVAAAAAAFRRDGVHATGLSDLMAAADLTHGGFYKHFPSKDRLVAEAAAVAADGLADLLAAALTDARAGRGLAAVAGHYCSAAHRDDPAGGCPVAAMGDELARAAPAARDGVTAGVRRILSLLAGQYPDATAAEAKRRAMAAFSTMVGAVVLSRVVSDADLSDAVLAAARRAVATPA